MEFAAIYPENSICLISEKDAAQGARYIGMRSVFQVCGINPKLLYRITFVLIYMTN